MSGVLYLVSLPIGNLADITYRAVETLRDVDWILAEDTRTTRHLLHHYDIQTPFFSSLYQGAEQQRVPQVVEQLKDGKSIALVSDAGTPLINDPGFPLVRAVIEQSLPVVPIPGACAILAALVASGLATDRFRFLGALPRGRGERATRFSELANAEDTLVFYESAHRILDSLELLAQELPDRLVVIARELTKMHEGFVRGTATEIAERLQHDDQVRGEFVLLVQRADGPPLPDEARIATAIAVLREAGVPNKTIVKLITNTFDVPRNEAYARVHEPA